MGYLQHGTLVCWHWNTRLKSGPLTADLTTTVIHIESGPVTADLVHIYM